jgi:hypothetical protein
MIDKFVASRIISIVHKNQLKGGAYAFGDQIPTFSKGWAERNINRCKQGKPFKDIDSGSAISADEFYKILGFSDYTDIDYNKKAKEALDLGKPVPEEFYSRASFLHDGGVIEHIPNIFQALINAALMVRRGGFILQGVPVSVYGESYYNIDPMLLKDFYGKNGFRMVDCILVYVKPSIKNSLLRKAMYHAYESPEPILKSLRAAYRIVFSGGAKTSAKGGTQTQPSTYNDRIKDYHILKPFNQQTLRFIKAYGVPYRTHVIYIGQKIKDIDKKNIIAPVQDNYPNYIG